MVDDFSDSRSRNYSSVSNGAPFSEVDPWLRDEETHPLLSRSAGLGKVQGSVQIRKPMELPEATLPLDLMQQLPLS